MFDNCKNTREQGDIGLAVAIAELSKRNYLISIPLTDNNIYDLIIEKDLDLYTVQVKTTSRIMPSGNFEVGLKRVRTNRSKNIIHKFNNEEVDYIYILTSDNTSYFIPSKNIVATSSITLGTKYNEYIMEDSVSGDKAALKAVPTTR